MTRLRCRVGPSRPLSAIRPSATSAGLGGVPIVYRFSVNPKSKATVALGLCESHWAEAGQRPLSCRVEGVAAQTIDPVAKWGQHKPGVLVFAARDENGDGKLEVVVLAAPGARDRNPILNAIWIFPAGESPNSERLVSGALNGAAIRYVDVGGQNDQSIYPPGKLEYRIELAAGGAQELTFLVACPNSSAPAPDTSTWTTALLAEPPSRSGVTGLRTDGTTTRPRPRFSCAKPGFPLSASGVPSQT